MTADEAQYCAEQVRRFDPERWLTILVAPATAQRDLTALYAFNLEIARVRESIRELHMGFIRLQWWRDAVTAARAGTARAHPVASELARTMRRLDVDDAPVLALIQAREADLNDTPCADLPALLDYAAATSGAAAALAMIALGERDAIAGGAARRVGTAWALLGILRAAPFLAAARRCYLPLDMLAEYGVTLESWFAGAPTPGARRVVGKIAATARDLLDGVDRAEVSCRGFSAIACAVLAKVYLRRLQAIDHDVFDARLQAPLPSAALRLTLARLLNRW